MAEWSPEEYDAALDSYLDLQEAVLAGRRLVKKELYRELHQRFPRRSEKSFERRFQNISSFLDQMGLTWVPGLVPLPNFSVTEMGASWKRVTGRRGMPAAVPEEPAPVGEVFAVKPAPRRVEPDVLSVTVPQWEAILEARNRNGQAGEQFVVDEERKRLADMGLQGAEGRVRHVSATYPTSPFDVLSAFDHGADMHIEVKTTAGPAKTAFYMSAAEYDFAQANDDSWRLYRVHGIGLAPRITVFDFGDLTTMNTVPAVTRFWP